MSALRHLSSALKKMSALRHLSSALEKMSALRHLRRLGYCFSSISSIFCAKISSVDLGFSTL